MASSVHIIYLACKPGEAHWILSAMGGWGVELDEAVAQAAIRCTLSPRQRSSKPQDNGISQMKPLLESLSSHNHILL